ncbi:MAG: acyl carrier protein [Nitrospira sp.]|nr:acyl carrier protein [Nitrospira sp.]
MHDKAVHGVREYLLNRYEAQIKGRGLRLEDIRDDFDLLQEGIIDSLGIMELLSDIDSHFDVAVDFEALDTSQLTVIGPLATYIEDFLSSQRPEPR